MQNAVRLLKIPLALFPSLVRKVALQNVKERNSLVLQLRKLVLGNAGLAGGNIPIHALNEDIYHSITWISNMQQLVQPGAGLGSVDCGVDELDLVAVYTLIYSVYI